MKYFIGTSGYSYNHWKGVFYPEDLPSYKWLEFYSKYFKVVELNVTFYRLPKETTFKNWYRRTPEEFKFVLKGSRIITHLKKLKEIEEPLELFFERVKGLKEKLKVVLWQFPPGFKADVKKLEKFCKLLKKKANNIFHAFEFRNKTWFSANVYKLLKSYKMSPVIADWPFDLKLKKKSSNEIQVPLTADFIYIRRHGPGQLYSSSYSDKELEELAQEIKDLPKRIKEVYVFFNNDAFGYAVKNALKLKTFLK